MIHPLTRRLDLYTHLSANDSAAIEVACGQIRKVGARRDLIHAGNRPQCIYVLLDGWAMRYKIIRSGRRQITSFLLPGDLFDLNLYILQEMDHSIGAVSPITVAEISRTAFEHLTDHHPKITKALMWHQLVMTGTEREWVANVGQRNAYQRIAHVLCELFVRLSSVGETDENRFYFPVTQADLADATGMTDVHANRIVGRLKREGLIQIEQRILTVINFNALRRTAQFDCDFLHLKKDICSPPQVRSQQKNAP
jgi:CRP-like cAMP-binding protein